MIRIIPTMDFASEEKSKSFRNYSYSILKRGYVKGNISSVTWVGAGDEMERNIELLLNKFLYSYYEEDTVPWFSEIGIMRFNMWDKENSIKQVLSIIYDRDGNQFISDSEIIAGNKCFKRFWDKTIIPQLPRTKNEYAKYYRHFKVPAKWTRKRGLSTIAGLGSN